MAYPWVSGPILYLLTLENGYLSCHVCVKLLEAVRDGVERSGLNGYRHPHGFEGYK